MINLQNSHAYELTQGSAINPELAVLNCESIQGDAVYEVLLYAKPNSEVRKNDGRLRDYWLNKYAHLAESGGLYFSGLDPQNNWEPMAWGRFKPNTPRLDSESKPQKYESPLKPATNRVSYFRVNFLLSWNIVRRQNEQACQSWCERAVEQAPKTEQSLSRFLEACRRREYGEIDCLLQPIRDRFQSGKIELECIGDRGIERFVHVEDNGFWSWIATHPEIPIILTEGEKKALCLLSQGFVAIGLPGIWGGRVGQIFLERLHPDLMAVAQKGRKFIILFDYETKPKTKWQVFSAISRTGQCILNVGCECEVALLPGPQKGIDDWVVAQGDKADQAVTALIGDTLSLSEYRKSFFIPVRGLGKYKPNIRLNVRYLSQGVERLPESGLVAISSDLGTGKTYLLEEYREKHPEERFLNNGHRVNLLKNLAERLKTQMYSAVNPGDLGRNHALSITIDSLYKLANNLQAYGCLFIDEAAQYLCHLLRSKTCKNFRAEILEVLEYLVRNSKLVVLADAHLDDITIDFFKAMRPKGEQPFIIQNDWKSGGREVFWYEAGSSSTLVAAIHIALLEGKKVIVVSDSKRFVKKLEKSLMDSPDFGGAKIELGAQSEETPEAEDDTRLRIWALHSENSGSEENVAMIKDITNSVKAFDVLIASPTIGTGVDICGGKADYHFDTIFGAFHGVSQPATECAQQLWRYRPNVPMHVWVAPRPPFGYKECNPRKIKEQILAKNEMGAFLIRIDKESGKRGAEKDWALDAYCQIEARRNRSINNLRQDLRSLLEEMENTIILMGDEVDEAAKLKMKAAGEAIDQAHCLAVSSAKEIDQLTYDSRQRQDYLSPEEFLECEKFRIWDTYGIDVTPELVEKDDGGRLVGKIANLEAVLGQPEDTLTDERGRVHTLPPQVVREKDLSERENLPICTDWKNHSVAWMMRHKLGLKSLLETLMSGVEYTNESDFLKPVVDAAHQYAANIKVVLGRTIAPSDSNSKIIGEFLGQLALSTIARRPNGEKRLRVYSVNPDDVEFLLQVLSHRQRKREEREKRRQEAAERNARHAAVIQRQWGVESPSTPPQKEFGSTKRGGVDGIEKQAEIPSEGWVEKVKEYGQLLVECFEYGTEVFEELLKPWTPQERWAAIGEFEAIAPQKMAELARIEPTWFEWCDL